MRFLHFSDLHLDAPHTAADADGAEGRRIRLRDAFSSVVLYAKQNGVRLVLISGDLLDHAYLTRETIARLSAEFASHPTCHFVIAPGNRDYFAPDSVYATHPFPDNVHIFSSATPACFTLSDIGAEVWGFAHVSPDMEGVRILSGIRPMAKRSGVRRFFCGHCAVLNGETVSGTDSTAESGTPPVVTKEQLAAFDFDYVALGYAHTSDGIRRIAHPVNGMPALTYYGYAGCLVGRGYDECGYRGAILGNIGTDDSGNVVLSVRRLRIARHHFETITHTFDANTVQTRADAMDALGATVRAAIDAGTCFDSDARVLVTLSGNLPPHIRITEADLRSLLSAASAVTLCDHTAVSDDPSLCSDTTLRGAYYRALLDARDARTDVADANLREVFGAALRIGLDALTDV